MAPKKNSSYDSRSSYELPQRSASALSNGRTTPMSDTTMAPSPGFNNRVTSGSSMGKWSSPGSYVSLTHSEYGELMERISVLEAALNERLAGPTGNAPRSGSTLGVHPLRTVGSTISERTEPSSAPGSRDGTKATPDKTIEAGISFHPRELAATERAAPPRDYEDPGDLGTRQPASPAHSRVGLMDHHRDTSNYNSRSPPVPPAAAGTQSIVAADKTRLRTCLSRCKSFNIQKEICLILMVGFMCAASFFFGVAFAQSEPISEDTLSKEKNALIAATFLAVHALIDDCMLAAKYRHRSPRYFCLYLISAVAYVAVVCVGWGLWRHHWTISWVLFLFLGLVDRKTSMFRWILEKPNRSQPRRSPSGDVESQSSDTSSDRS